MDFPSHLFKPHAPRDDAFIPFDPAEIEGDIVTRFEQQVDLYPDHLAYEDAAGNRLTYAELDAAANRVAHHLLDTSPSMDAVPVGVYCDPGPQQIIALIGVIKTGAFVVGLDPTYPTNRTLELLSLSQAVIVLTDSANSLAAAFFESETRRVINIDDFPPSGSDARPHVAIDPSALSHIFYTSGSTGQPKGVTHSHRSILHCIGNMITMFAMRHTDRSALVSSLTYGGSLLQLYAALLCGAAVVPYDTQRLGMRDMGAWLRDLELSVLICNATIVRQCCQYVDETFEVPNMRLVQIGGEELRTTDVDLHRRWFPHSTLGMNYGSSEGLLVTSSRMNPPFTEIDLAAVPCGYNFGQHQVLLLDEEGEPVADGEVGQFAIRSRYLSPGYWRQPELTAQTFRDDPDDPSFRIFLSGDLGRRNQDGLFFHLGRKDTQLKIRGFRVEPGEIESRLLQIDGLREAVVIGHENPNGDKQLVAYLVAEDDRRFGVDELRHTLSQSLPDHMIPTHIMYLDALPFTTSKKLDRRKLPAPRSERPALVVPYAPPRNPLEERVAAVWAEVLGLDKVGIHDGFFDLGGHSLLATELIVRISEVFQLSVSFEALFDAPTVARMAALIRTIAADDNPVIQAIDAVPREGYQMKVDQEGALEDDAS